MQERYIRLFSLKPTELKAYGFLKVIALVWSGFVVLITVGLFFIYEPVESRANTTQRAKAKVINCLKSRPQACRLEIFGNKTNVDEVLRCLRKNKAVNAHKKASHPEIHLYALSGKIYKRVFRGQVRDIEPISNEVWVYGNWTEAGNYIRSVDTSKKELKAVIQMGVKKPMVILPQHGRFKG